MKLRINYLGGRSEDFTNVRYTSLYPQKQVTKTRGMDIEVIDATPMMRVEFFADCEPALSIELATIQNITTIDEHKL